MKMISVIVPNYNYAQFLPKRLSSIIHQSITPDEIIFLDDASSDDSISLADNILQKSQIPFRIITNQVNSNSVFKQWQKGVENASGDVIWIAEADDYADPLFLETILPAFNNPDTGIAYCESSLINEKGVIFSDSRYQDIHNNIVPDKWKSEYVNYGIKEIQDNLSVRNTIPNVSAVLFRKSALQESFPIPTHFTLSGDWYAYLKILQNSDVHFYPSKLNYHRFHTQRVTHTAINEDLYYKEYFQVLDFISPLIIQDQAWEKKILDNIFFEAAHLNYINDATINELFLRFDNSEVRKRLSHELSTLYAIKKQQRKSFIERLKTLTLKKIQHRFIKRKI